MRPSSKRSASASSGVSLAERSAGRPVFLAVTLVWIVALAGSGIAPRDRGTWLLEVAPVLIALPLLWATRKSFDFTPLAYALIGLHGLILIVGGMYTYAHVPAGFWVQEWLGLDRNPYDRLGHFAQGFVPAIVARELLIRVFRLAPGRFLFFVTTCVCLAISAFYEMIEWWAALALEQGADEFLGTQGDPWDTQWDMFLALVGAATAQLLLSRRHDRQVAAVKS
jgi:putative membrane protein